MTVEIGQQVQMLEAACRHLLLRPDDADVRENLARTIAIVELAATPADTSFVRGLIAEVRSHADSVAFRLEGAGYDCLHVSATAAMLCQTLVHLRAQLPQA